MRSPTINIPSRIRSAVAVAEASGKPAKEASETPDAGMVRALNPSAGPAVSDKPAADEIKPAAQ